MNGEWLQKMDVSWGRILEQEFEKPYFQDLSNFLKSEKALGKTIFPLENQIFSAFHHTPFDKVKVVILGQDPYHRQGQAHGLSFSVQENIVKPGSLRNIFKELNSDLGIPMPKSGTLTQWADQGVLLLNSVLTVEQSLPRSHHGKGWEQFTNAAIQALSKEKSHLVFVLWGREAAAKESFIDKSKHLILKSAHPSGLSANRGFFGSRPFSLVNNYLTEHGIEPVDW